MPVRVCATRICAKTLTKQDIDKMQAKGKVYNAKTRQDKTTRQDKDISKTRRDKRLGWWYHQDTDKNKAGRRQEKDETTMRRKQRQHNTKITTKEDDDYTRVRVGVVVQDNLR